MSTRVRKSAAPRGYKHVRTYQGVEEYELTKNGLRVLYRHDDSTPVVGIMVTYLVGSRHEATGHTGATHLLEHLMFKGSKRFPKRRGVSVLDTLSEKGALVNASTWYDRTNYFEVLPDEHFEFALALEADRMRNAIITRKDLDEEMPAVRSEYAMYENDAKEYLDKHVWATAFLAHPYHHSTIGWLDDIEHVSLERLKEFYDTYYWPNNAYVSVVGNIERGRALARIAELFSVHSRSPAPIPVPYTSEPPQQGRRFVEVSREGTTNVVELAFKVPEAMHTDVPALMALANILAEGATSRLYKTLVEKRLCSGVSGRFMPFRDPSLFVIFATPVDGVAHEKVERVILHTIETLVRNGITRQELAKELALLKTSEALARDGHYATLSSLNEALAAGDWRIFFDLPNKVSALTPDDIRNVASKYLIDTSLTAGYYRAQNT